MIYYSCAVPEDQDDLAVGVVHGVFKGYVEFFLFLAFHELPGALFGEDEVGQVGGVVTRNSFLIVAESPPN